MTHIGDVAHIANFETEVKKIAVENVKCEKGAYITQMNEVIHRRTANIQPHKRRIKRLKFFFLPIQAVVDAERVLHAAKLR
jgi:hypothetical protein